MNTFLRFLYDNPFFAACFLFYTIPFWVPLLAIFFGADPVLMLILSALSIMAKSYIQSEILASNPFDMMFTYFFTAPLMAFFRFLLTALLIGLIIAYAMQGEPLDKGIAAVMIVFILKLMYFRPQKNLYWHVSGLRVYRFYNIAGRLFTAFLWLVLMSVKLDLFTSLAVGFLAVLTAGFTFYKTNEGLL